MGFEKVGITLGKEIIAWTRTSGKNLIATKPVKINTCGLKYAPELKSDVFLLKTPAENSPQKILSKIDLNKCLSEATELGSGAEASVYRIKGTDFALRIHHDMATGHKVRILDLSEGINFNISPEDKVNYIVGKFKGGEIIKYIKGKIVQNTCSKEMCRSINNLSDKSIKDYFRKILEAKKLGLYHDNFGANALFDETTGKLTPIDFWTNKSEGILSSIMDQCRSPYQYINREKLLKKSVRNLLEMCKKGEIDSKQLNLTVRESWLYDKIFASEIKNICSNFNQNKSKANIDTLLEKINRLDEFSPTKIEHSIAKLRELEKALEKVSAAPGDTSYKQASIKVCIDSIEKMKSVIEWQKNEVSYIS